MERLLTLIHIFGDKYGWVSIEIRYHFTGLIMALISEAILSSLIMLKTHITNKA